MYCFTVDYRLNKAPCTTHQHFLFYMGFILIYFLVC